MFGQYFRKLDDKNRVMIPVKLRAKLGSIVYLTLGFDQILELRNKDDFEVFKDKLLNVNMLSSKARSLTRALLGNTLELEIDNQGRINIPLEFSQNILIKNDIVFLGVGNKIELWSKEKWQVIQDEFKEFGSIEKLALELKKEGEEI